VRARQRGRGAAGPGWVGGRLARRRAGGGPQPHGDALRAHGPHGGRAAHAAVAAARPRRVRPRARGPLISLQRRRRRWRAPRTARGAARPAHRDGGRLHHERPLEALLGRQRDVAAAHDLGLRMGRAGAGERRRWVAPAACAAGRAAAYLAPMGAPSDWGAPPGGPARGVGRGAPSRPSPPAPGRARPRPHLDLHSQGVDALLVGAELLIRHRGWGARAGQRTGGVGWGVVGRTPKGGRGGAGPRLGGRGTAALGKGPLAALARARPPAPRGSGGAPGPPRPPAPGPGGGARVRWRLQGSCGPGLLLLGGRAGRKGGRRARGRGVSGGGHAPPARLQCRVGRVSRSRQMAGRGRPQLAGPPRRGAWLVGAGGVGRGAEGVGDVGGGRGPRGRVLSVCARIASRALRQNGPKEEKRGSQGESGARAKCARPAGGGRGRGRCAQ
jgi:hypothetical protein